MTPVIATPPDYRVPTVASAIIVAAPINFGSYALDDLVAEQMDYSPIGVGRLAAYAFPDEAWTADPSGPMGF